MTSSSVRCRPCSGESNAHPPEPFARRSLRGTASAMVIAVTDSTLDTVVERRGVEFDAEFDPLSAGPEVRQPPDTPSRRSPTSRDEGAGAPRRRQRSSAREILTRQNALCFLGASSHLRGSSRLAPAASDPMVLQGRPGYAPLRRLPPTRVVKNALISLEIIAVAEGLHPNSTPTLDQERPALPRARRSPLLQRHHARAELRRSRRRPSNSPSGAASNGVAGNVRPRSALPLPQEEGEEEAAS